MALNSRQKRASVVGVARAWYRNSHPSSVNASQRASIGQVYPVAVFQGVSAPVFTGTIPDISVTENTGTYTYDLSTYFAGATSYSISPAIEAGWTFNTTTAELVIDTDDTKAFGPYTVTGTNTGGSAVSNGFNVEVISGVIVPPNDAQRVPEPGGTGWSRQDFKNKKKRQIKEDDEEFLRMVQESLPEILKYLNG